MSLGPLPGDRVVDDRATDGTGGGRRRGGVRRARDGGRVLTARDVYRKNWAGLSDPDVVTAGLNLLTDYRHLRQREAEAGGFGGRPTAAYAWEAA